MDVIETTRERHVLDRGVARKRGIAGPQSAGYSLGMRLPQGTWLKVDWSQSNIEIARRLGVSRKRVRVVRRRLGIRPVGRLRPVRVLRQPQFARLPAGLSMREIARRFKMPYHQVWHWCRRLGYVPAMRSGTAYTLRQAQFRKLEPGLTLDQIAARLHLSRMSACRWTHRLGYQLHGVGRPRHH